MVKFSFMTGNISKPLRIAFYLLVISIFVVLNRAQIHRVIKTDLKYWK